MNRILFTPDEIAADGTVRFGGVRAEHVLGVLHGEVGQTLKTGEINGPIGTSEILAIGDSPSSTVLPLSSAAARPSTVLPLSSAAARPSTVLPLSSAAARPTPGDGPLITVRTHHDAQGPSPWVDLILAPPRPRVFKRLLPQLAALGVGKIVLVGAKKVEKDFWGATLLKTENYTPLLVDGLMQAGTSALPTLETRRNFRRFVTDELDTLFPTARRIVAHPYSDGDSPSSTVLPLSSAAAHPTTVLPLSPAAAHPTSGDSPRGRLLLAVGPEGGWTDDEVALLEAHGFARYSLGKRILRTDTATIALLAKLNEENE